MSASEARTRRAYDASTRRQAADERRDRVLEVAGLLFAERGWAGTTIGAVARRAGVSPQLVTAAFGTKAELFMKAFQRRSFGPGLDLVAAFEAAGVTAGADLEARLDGVVGFACASLRPMAALVPALNAAVGADPDMLAEVRAGAERHWATARAVADLLVGGSATDAAAAEVYAMTLAEVYLSFVRDLGWSEDDYAAWLRRGLARVVHGHNG